MEFLIEKMSQGELANFATCACAVVKIAMVVRILGLMV
jgi:hypothetical protein